MRVGSKLKLFNIRRPDGRGFVIICRHISGTGTYSTSRGGGGAAATSAGTGGGAAATAGGGGNGPTSGAGSEAVTEGAGGGAAESGGGTAQEAVSPSSALPTS